MASSVPFYTSTAMAAAALWVLLLNLSHGFSPSTTTRRHKRHVTLVPPLAASIVDVERAASPSSSAPGATIDARQAAAERHARSIHDNFAMNALFVNLPERPDPQPCSFHPNSRTDLPPDFPPGALLRIGPNGAPTDAGFLDGDGMLHCITLPPPDQNVPPLHSSTYVQTTGRKLERAARIKSRRTKAARFSSGVGSPPPDPTFGGTLGAAPKGLPMLGNLLRNGITFGTLTPQKDTCNTALAESGGRVLALMEQSPPSEISVGKNGRVRTVGSTVRLGGAVPEAPINGGSLGAHGRTDPGTGERIHVTYRSDAKPYVRIDAFDDEWELARTTGIDLPAPVMVHDCAVTKDYVVILDFPLTIRPARMLRNNFPVEYEPENGARIGLVPRRNDRGDGADAIWFDVESGVVLHAANAYERNEDGMVVVHAFKSVPSGDASYILDYTPAFLYEWVLDPKTQRVVSERCLNPDVMVEFPQVEDQLIGRQANSCYGLVTTSIGGPMLQFKTPETGVLLDGVVKFALNDEPAARVKAGDVLGRFDLPRGWHSVSEPTLVAKTIGEGHYVLLVATYVPDDKRDYKHVDVALDGSSMKSQLLILDGDDIANGPVTAIDLPSHVNYGLHSLFLEWDKMK